jgi:hypothetical protein
LKRLRAIVVFELKDELNGVGGVAPATGKGRAGHRRLKFQTREADSFLIASGKRVGS